MAASPASAGRVEAQFVRFAAVGAVGFVIDASVLTALVVGAGLGHYAARALSFGTAATATWLLNRHAVFAPTRRRSREYAGYIVVQGVGALINLGTYVLVIEAVPALAAWPVIPLGIGAVLALAFNFLAARRFVFRSAEKPI